MTTVHVIEDDASFQKSLARLLRVEGYRVEVHPCPKQFFEDSLQTWQEPGEGDVLVVDLRLPYMSGLEVQRRLKELDLALALIFISAHADIATSVTAMKAGAVDFLEKPFTDQEFLQTLRNAVEAGRMMKRERRRRKDAQERYARLTRREKQVFQLVVAGCANKVIAAELGAAEATVKIHRRRVMEKMEVESLADLVRLSEILSPSLEKKGLPS